MFNWYWRLFATGLSFFIFGLGGLLVQLFILPVLYLLPGGEVKRIQRVRTAVHYEFRLFVEIMRVLGVLSYQVSKRDSLNSPGQLILANHPSLIDVVFLLAFIKQADCIVKSSLKNNPFLAWSINSAGYISNDNPEKVLDKAAESLAAGNSLIIFPESTRSTPGKRLTLRRGAANVAVRTQTDISPVIIGCYPPTLTKDLRWYQIPQRRFQFSLNPKDTIRIQPFLENKSSSIAARQLTNYLENFFNAELNLNERTGV